MPGIKGGWVGGSGIVAMNKPSPGTGVVELEEAWLGNNSQPARPHKPSVVGAGG